MARDFYSPQIINIWSIVFNRQATQFADREDLQTKRPHDRQLELKLAKSFLGGHGIKEVRQLDPTADDLIGDPVLESFPDEETILRTIEETNRIGCS